MSLVCLMASLWRYRSWGLSCLLCGVLSGCTGLDSGADEFSLAPSLAAGGAQGGSLGEQAFGGEGRSVAANAGAGLQHAGGGSSSVAGGAAGGGNGGRSAEGTPENGADALDVLGGTTTRPELNESQAVDYTVLKYLAQAGNIAAPIVDNWDPTAGVGDAASFRAAFAVAVSGGTHTTVQGAIDAATLVGGTDRVYIQLEPGTYSEVVCVKSNAPPITLYSTHPDASKTVIVFDNYGDKPKGENDAANPCTPNIGAGRTTFGMAGSATFSVYSRAFHAKNLTFANDFDETSSVGNVQGVALLTQADQVVLENVRLRGNQNTLYVKTSSVETIQRVYVKDSYIEGDVDFITGRATLVIQGGIIHSLSTRPGVKTYALSPGTDSRNRYGILVSSATFTADAGAAVGSTFLGRAWDESLKDLSAYAASVATGMYPNGQALIQKSSLGAHIRTFDPWSDAASSKRPFSSTPGDLPANRMYEFSNNGPGAK